MLVTPTSETGAIALRAANSDFGHEGLTIRNVTGEERLDDEWRSLHITNTSRVTIDNVPIRRGARSTSSTASDPTSRCTPYAFTMSLPDRFETPESFCRTRAKAAGSTPISLSQDDAEVRDGLSDSP